MNKFWFYIELDWPFTYYNFTYSFQVVVDHVLQLLEDIISVDLSLPSSRSLALWIINSHSTFVYAYLTYFIRQILAIWRQILRPLSSDFVELSTHVLMHLVWSYKGSCHPRMTEDISYTRTITRVRLQHHGYQIFEHRWDV